MQLYPNIYRTLAPGPIVELRGYAAACRLPGRLYACLDFGGPTGTARDGLAEGMLALAAERKALTPGQTLIEAGSGAFATALTLARKSCPPWGRSCSFPRRGRGWPAPSPWPAAGPKSGAGTSPTGWPATTTPSTTAG